MPLIENLSVPAFCTRPGQLLMFGSFLTFIDEHSDLRGSLHFLGDGATRH